MGLAKAVRRAVIAAALVMVSPFVISPLWAGDPVIEDPVKIDPNYPPAVRELRIDSNGATMYAHIYLADGAGPHPTVVLLHGFPGFEKNLDIAQAIRRSGWNVLFFHYRGAWGSEGVFSFSNGIEDVAAALAFLRDPENAALRVDASRIALIGHSMGGFMALQGGAVDGRVKCIAGIAAANLGDRALIAEASPDALDGFKKYSDTLGMLNGFSGDSAIAELAAAGASFDLRQLAPRLAGKSIFLIAGERDQAVNISVFESLVQAYKTTLGIDLAELRLDADHSFSWHRIRLSGELAGWLNQSCR
ncbi:MAG: alpha/beta fold hydrolase [Alphaproteobacteria bacterium]|nr:alpha/beta fold hydrolase [Alphaproteobacteria bacterium]